MRTTFFLYSNKGQLIYASDSAESVVVASVGEMVHAFAQKMTDSSCVHVERIGEATLEIKIIGDDQFTGIVAIYSHDTSQFEHQRITELSKLNQELEDIFETSNDGIVVANKDGMFTRINSSYERISGLKRSKILGVYCHEIVKKRYVSNSATCRVLEERKPVTLNQTFRTGRSSYITANPFFSADGSILRVITNVRDTTELNTLKSELEKSQAKVNLFSQLIKDVTNGQGQNLHFISQAMKDLYRRAYQYAQVDAPLLIFGETGVGKEVLANYIHENSPRKNKPFLKINCAAIPDQLLETELFGYEDGAFTGAKKGGKPGLFEQADGGTLLLDEIGEISMNLQAKLLRFVQHKEYYKVSGNRLKTLDVRLLSATNNDLEERVAAKKFRADLFYRLNVLNLEIPPLRDRKEDILILSDFFLNQLNAQYEKLSKFTTDVTECFLSYTWPGNVRELENTIENLVITSDGHDVIEDALPCHIRNAKTKKVIGMTHNRLGSYHQSKRAFDFNYWSEAMKIYPSYRRAAKALGVNHATVLKKAALYGLRLKCRDDESV